MSKKKRTERKECRKLRRLTVEDRNSTYRGRACIYGTNVGIMEKFNNDDTVDVMRKGVTHTISIDLVTFY